MPELFNLDPAAAQNPELVAMAATLTAALEGKIKPVTVKLLASEDMEKRSDGGVAFGYWRSGPREIHLWDETDEYPAAKTLAHEAMHVLDTDWLNREQRKRLLALMSPVPTAWSDQKIGDKVVKYKALPSEVFAVYASAAIAGLKRPAYMGLYKRTVEVDRWKIFKDLTLQRDGLAQQEEEEGEPAGSPPDDDFDGQLRDAEERVAAAMAARKTAELGQALAEEKLTKAKNKALEINAL